MQVPRPTGQTPHGKNSRPWISAPPCRPTRVGIGPSGLRAPLSSWGSAGQTHATTLTSETFACCSGLKFPVSDSSALGSWGDPAPLDLLVITFMGMIYGGLTPTAASALLGHPRLPGGTARSTGGRTGCISLSQLDLRRQEFRVWSPHMRRHLQQGSDFNSSLHPRSSGSNRLQNDLGSFCYGTIGFLSEGPLISPVCR